MKPPEGCIFCETDYKGIECRMLLYTDPPGGDIVDIIDQKPKEVIMRCDSCGRVKCQCDICDLCGKQKWEACRCMNIKTRKKDKVIGKYPKNRRTTNRYKKHLARIVACVSSQDIKTTIGSRKFRRLILQAKDLLGRE